MLKWTTGHPLPSVAASIASFELDQIQEKRGIWFCRAYQGAIAAQGLLRRTNSVLNNPRHMVHTWTETEACLLVTRFLKSFITTGCIIILPDRHSWRLPLLSSPNPPLSKSLMKLASSPTSSCLC